MKCSCPSASLYFMLFDFVLSISHCFALCMSIEEDLEIENFGVNVCTKQLYAMAVYNFWTGLIFWPKSS